MKYRAIALLIVLVVVAAACGKSNKVGDESLLNIKDQTNNRLGATTTTTAPPAESTTSTTAASKAGIGNTTTTAKAVTTTTAPAAALEISINSDESPTQFAPPEGRLFEGQTVRWTNKDNVNRSVRADNRAFISPSIPPGGTYTWVAKGTGRINYSDGTRPYAVGAIEVVGR